MLSVVVLICYSPAGWAQDDTNPHVWEPGIQSVSVFKNGLGFFLREGEVSLRDGWCHAKRIPPAAFGTLAIYSLDSEQLVDIVGAGPGEIVEFDGKDAEDCIVARVSRLEAAKNLNVQLSYKHKGQARSAAGKVVSVGADYAVLESNNNSFAVPLKGITRMQILELPMRIHLQADNGEVPEKTQLGMAYLRKGITWIPEYTVKILDDTTAEITLRGTLVNEAEDLVNCDVNFVVGVPHFTHTDYMAPIAVGQVIRTIGSALAPVNVRNQIASRAAISFNGIQSDQFGYGNVVEQPVNDGANDLSKSLGNLPTLGTTAGTDYTVYTKEKMTIRKGEKAIVTLFVGKITYSHIYRWTTSDKMKHFLVLDNDTETAWTTGPYLAISADRPLSEDLLKYTPKGGKCEIPVTHAINIAHAETRSEIDRELKAHNPRSSYYLDLVMLDGEIRLRNFEKRTVDIVVTTVVPGRPISAGENGVIRQDHTKLKLTERSGTITWRITLDAGESRTITYKYEQYVSSG
jgi:hypothetical protein